MPLAGSRERLFKTEAACGIGLPVGKGLKQSASEVPASETSSVPAPVGTLLSRRLVRKANATRVPTCAEFPSNVSKCFMVML